jgi:hypothetical protein
MSLSIVRFECMLCGVTAGNKNDMLQHMMKGHTMGVGLDCSGCSKRMRSKLAIGNHMMTHTRMTECMSHSEICQHIALVNGLQYVPVAGDGSCQYAAVSIALRACGFVPDYTVSQLRSIAADEIEKNRDTYIHAIGSQFQDYCRGVRRDAWGDHITLQALSSALNICVHVYSFTMISEYIHHIGNEDSTHHIHVTLDNRHAETAHYDALIVPSSQAHVSQQLSSAANEESQPVLTTLPTIHEVEQGSSGEPPMPFASADPVRSRSTKVSSSNVVVQPTKQKECCPYCNRMFVNLADHKKCPKRDISDTESVQSMTSVSSTGSRRSARLATRSVVAKPATVVHESAVTGITGKEECPFCHRWFVNLANHKKCPKRLESQRQNTDTFESTQVHNILSASKEQMEFSSNKPQLSHSKSGKTRKGKLQVDVKQRLEELKRTNPPWTEFDMASKDEKYLALKAYHDQLSTTVENLTTEKISKEVAAVIDVAAMESREHKERDTAQQFCWSKEEEEKLNKLTAEAKTMVMPKFRWNAPTNSTQGRYNHSRFQFLVKEQLQWRILKCPQCSVTTLLVGLDEINSDLCMQCVEMNRKRPETRKKYMDAWSRVKPADNVPELPKLSPAENALIALVQPVVTIQKNYMYNKKFRQESINLLHNVSDTWCRIIPRLDLQDRFIVVERRFKNKPDVRYMVADPAKIRIWLQFLFKNHTVYMRKLANNDIELSEDALQALEAQSELASVDHDDKLPDIDEIQVE